MRSTIRTTIAALGVVAALSLSACSDDSDDAASDEPAGEQTEAEDAADEEDDTEQSGGEQSDVFDVEVGNCIGDFQADEEVSNVDVVPCEEPHDQEIYAIFEVPDGEFPGEDSFEAQVQEDCIPEFETFIGMAWQESALDIKWLQPTEESWGEGDRELVCTVYEEGVPTTGTLEGAQR